MKIKVTIHKDDEPTLQFRDASDGLEPDAIEIHEEDYREYLIHCQQHAEWQNWIRRLQTQEKDNV